MRFNSQKARERNKINIFRALFLRLWRFVSDTKRTRFVLYNKLQKRFFLYDKASVFFAIIFALCAGFTGTHLVWSKGLSLDQELSTTNTLHVYPSSVENNSWSGVEHVLAPDLGEDAIYQNFNANNSAYVPLTAVVVNDVKINADNGNTEVVTLDANTATTSDATATTTDTSSPATDETTPTSTSPSSLESSNTSDAANATDTQAAVNTPKPLAQATESFFTFFSMVTQLLPFVNQTAVVDPATSSVEHSTTVSSTSTNDSSTSTSKVIDEVKPEDGLSASSTLDASTTNEVVTNTEAVDATTTLPEIQTATTSSSTSESEKAAAVPVDTPSVPQNQMVTKTIKLSDFSTPELKHGEFISSMQLRMSLAAKYHQNALTSEAPVIEIRYLTPSSTQEVGSITVDDEVSNALNGGYFLFALPAPQDVKSLADVSVEITYKGDIENLRGMYLDAVWLEMNVEKIDRTALLSKELNDIADHLGVPKFSTLLSEKRDFTRDELPFFTLRYNSQRNIAIRFLRSLFGQQLASVDKIALLHNGEEDTGIIPEMSVTQDGLITIQLTDADKERLKPGNYTVLMDVNEGGVTYTDSFTFQWGLLSVNPDKTSYKTGETATISMGALSQDGNTVCDANLNLYITDTQNNTYPVTVTPSGQCTGNNVVDVPDYSSTFTPTTPGTYTMELDRVDDTGAIVAHTSDTFLVRDQLPLSIKREGPTRIYPSAAYPMKLTVLSDAPWSGKLIESVPDSFDITNTDATITHVGNKLELSWDIDTGKALSQTVTYTFDAPDLSPYLYELGEARLEGPQPSSVHYSAPAVDQPVISPEASSTIPVSETPTATTEEATTSQPQENIIQKILDIFHIGGQPAPEATSTVEQVPEAPATDTTTVEEQPSASDAPATATSTDNSPQTFEPATETTTTVATPTEQMALTVTTSNATTTNASSTQVVFQEHRFWQVASDATGNMILYWDGGTSLPSGWTCLSCGSGTFYQKFAMGSSTYNTTGGVSTTTPTATASVPGASAASVAINANAGTGIANVAHTHTAPSLTITGASTLPSYRQLRVIQYTAAAGEPANIPTGAIGLFDATVPAGWTRYSAQDNFYIYGGNSVGTTGGSNTHTHTITGTVGAAAGSSNRTRAGGTQTTVAANAHTHTISTTTGAMNTEPPYITAIIGKLNATTTPPNGLITMWSDSVPSGWTDVSSAGAAAFHGKFVKGSATYGTTGGALTHTFANMNNVPTGGPSATVSTRITGTTASTNNHTHTLNITGFSAESNLPPYLTVVYGKRADFNPRFNQLSWRWYANTNNVTPTDPWPSGGTNLSEKAAITATSTPVGTGAVIRLRMNALVSNVTAPTSTALKLQYGLATSTCNLVSTWSYVGAATSSSIWRGYDNTSVTNHTTLSSHVLASSTVNESYEEHGLAASFPNQITVGGVGEWDWVLNQNNATPSTTYCFRMVKSDGSPLLSYTSYPRLLTNRVAATPTEVSPFDNNKNPTTTPTFSFYTTDPEDDNVEYEIVVDDNYDFSSPVFTKQSSNYPSDAGWTAATFSTGNAGTWYNTSWTYRIPITIHASLVNEDVTNFPVYVNLANLGASFFSNVKSDGGDIRVTAANGSTELPREIVSISTGSKTGEIYFKADSLSSTTDSTFYLYYGNASASDYAVTATYGRNNVWTNGYSAVYHFNADPSSAAPQYIDSTGHSAGTSVNMVSGDRVAGIAGYAASVDGVNKHITTNLNAGSLTNSTWSIFLNDNGTQGGCDGVMFSRGTNVSGIDAGACGDATRLGYHWNDVAATYNWATGPVYPTSKWYLASMVQQPTQMTMSIYQPSGVTSASNVVTHAASTIDNLNFGWDSFGVARSYAGLMDEARLSSVARTSGWVMAEYKNIASSTSFYGTSTVQTLATSGTATYTVQPSNALTNGTTYWWKIRARDLNGSNTWTSYSNPQSFTIDTSLTDNAWFQTTGYQFQRGTRSNVSTTTTTAVIQLLGNNVSTTTDSFEGTTNGNADLSSTKLWKQASISTDNGDWWGTTGGTPSANTGPSNAPDGSFSIYAEASAGQPCDNTTTAGNTCIIEADIADGTLQGIRFNYHMYGANIATLNLDVYDGSTWTNVWTKTGQQSTGLTDWKDSGYLDLSSYRSTSKALRFSAVTNGAGFADDIALDYIRVATSSTAVGTLMSPEIPFSDVPGHNTWGTVNWNATQPLNTNTKLQVYYTNATACDTIVPDAAIAGNSTGFAPTASPLFIYGISTSTYHALCLKETFNLNSGTSSPSLNDWTVNWVVPNQPPATPHYAINPAFDNEKSTTTTPTLGGFVTDDFEHDSMEYKLVVSKNYNLSSPVLVKDSVNYPSDSGWSAATFAAAATTTYVIQPSDALTEGDTYWWAVLARDPSGTNTWSATSSPRSITISTVSTIPKWYQTTGAQFALDTLTNTAVTATGTILSTTGTTTTFDQLDTFNSFTGNPDCTLRPAYGNWTAQNGSDGTDGWATVPNTTASAGTGPSGPYDGAYLYLESSATGQACAASATLGSSQYVESNTIDASTYALNFEFVYNMTGAAMDTGPASLHVDAWNGTSWDLDVNGGAVNSGQQTAWTSSGVIDLSSYTNSDFKVRIRYVMSTGGTVYQNDVALDDLHIYGDQRSTNSGSIMSQEVNFKSVPNQNTWGEVNWHTTEPTAADTLLHVYYTVSTPCDTIVPDAAIAGNSTGFDVSQSPIDISSLSTTTYSKLCLKADLDQGGSKSPSLDDWTIKWVKSALFTENNYRWYANTNNITPTDPWPVGATDLAQNEAIDSDNGVVNNAVLRLRMSLTGTSTAASAGSVDFKLQYAAGNTCSSALSWRDVGAIGSTTALWRGYNNTSVSDGATLTSTKLASSTVLATYEEENNSAPNPNAINPNAKAEWDWVLQSNSAAAGTNYCFRMVYTDGTRLKSYTNYPQLITNSHPNTSVLYAPFNNEKTQSTTPDFEFGAFDTEDDDVDYEIQIDNNSDFSSPVIDDNSVSNLVDFVNTEAPADKSPFTSSQRIRFTPTTALTNGVTYWWRVRAKDTNGSGQYGNWSTSYSFTVDTSVTISTWFQTTQAQFNTDSLVGTQATAGNLVSLATSSSIGTTTSDAITFSDATIGNAWGEFSFNDTGGAGAILYHLEYYNGDQWSTIPDSALSGNAAGFDTSPVNLSNLDTSIYSVIRIRANFNSGSPTLTDWTVKWGQRVSVPTLVSPFDNEKFSTTTPTLKFYTTDPEGDDLQYEVSWSTDYAFLTGSTTRNSSSSPGFVNVNNGGDTNPFNSGDTITYKIQPGDALSANTTYWWKVRAKDPNGSNSYSFWSSPESFTTATSGESVSVSTWYQTVKSQFETDSLTDLVASTSNSVIVGGGITLKTASTSNTALTTGASLTITKPTGISVGDLLLIMVGNDDNTNTAQWDNTTHKPTGFTLINEAGSNVPDAHVAAFYRVADGTEGSSITIPSVTNADYWGFYTYVSGVDNSSPINVTGADYIVNNLNSHPVTSITTTVANTLAFYVLAADGGDNYPFTVSGTGWVQRNQIRAGTGAGNAAGVWGSKSMPSAGATGAATVGMSTVDGASAFQFALNPATITSGKIVSTPIVFSDGNGPAWGDLSWHQTTPGSSNIKYKIEYKNGVGNWYEIPDSDLAGNSSGFTSGPVNLKYLNTTTYNTIRAVAYFTCVASNCPTLQDWTVHWSKGFSISGKAFEYNGTASTTSGTVAVAVNGTLQTGKTGTILANGTWTINDVTFFSGDVITVFATGAADANEAVAVTKYDGTPDITGMRLQKRHLSIGSDDNATITNVNLGLYDDTQTEDIFYNVDAGNDLTMCADVACADASVIVLANNTYSPTAGADLTTYNMQIDGTYTPGPNTVRVGGSWDNNSVFNSTGSTVIFTATTSTQTVDSTGSSVDAFNNVTFGQTSGAATWSLQSALNVNGNSNVTYGTLNYNGAHAANLSGNLTIGSSGHVTKGTATTTFNGTALSVISDASSPKQDLGIVVIDGTTKTAQLGSDVTVTNFVIGADDTFGSSGSTYNLTVKGNWKNNNVFTAGLGTVTFAATSTGKTINTGASSFYNLAFNGVGGAWSFTQSSVTVGNDFTIATGTVTLPTATTTIAGSFTNSGGTFIHNNAVVKFTSSSAKTITQKATAFTNAFYDVLFSGTGSWTFTEANATTSHNFKITQGSVTLPSNTLSIGASFLNTGGSFTHNSGTVKFTSTAGSQTISALSSFYSLLFAGTGGNWSFSNSNITAAGNVTISAGTVTFPSNTFTIGGSFANTATFANNNGTVLFNATATGKTINPGSSSFKNLTFNSATGGWTINANATTSANATLTAGTFTLASSSRLTVLGTFTNSIGGASTTWTGSTLALNAGSYSINTKTTGGDVYGTLSVASSTNIKMWNSSATTYAVDQNGSLYSQDHAGVDGDLYIWGTYTRSSGTEYWNYDTDFDGTALSGGSRRAVNVKFGGTQYVQVFTAGGTFTPPAGVTSVDVLVVAGGGGGGAATGFGNAGAGGGGGGGLVYKTNYSVTPLTGIGVTVGGGGNGGSGGNISGTAGSNSTFGSLTALGGGGGAGGNVSGTTGGSGGGSRGATGGAATQPGSGSGGFGNRGGNSGGSPAGAAATGGGGAGGAGEDLAGTAGEKGGNGGVGLSYDISGTATYYAGGGGGGAAQTNTPVGTGGNGGGGNGGNNGTNPVAGTANTGGGGGGGNNAKAGANGGSGIVIVRYTIGSTFNLTGGTLNIVGSSSATTTVTTQASSTYAFNVKGGTVNAQYYKVRNTNSSGLKFTGTPTITSLANGDFQLSNTGYSMMTVSSTTINSNAALQIQHVRFATSTGVSSGYNVSQTDGTPTSYWWFRNASGNFKGEAHDNDTGNPGSIRWDDSALVITVSGTVYSDEGVTPITGGTCNGVATPVRIVVNSGTTYDGTCSAVNGTYSIPGVTIVGDSTLTVFLNGASGGQKAVTVTKTPTANITGLDLYANHTITRHQDVSAMTIADMAKYDSTKDSDILFTAATGTSNTLITKANSELYVWASTTFTPGGTVTLKSGGTGTSYDGSLYIAHNAAFTGAGTTTYSVGGNLTFATSSTFTAASSTVAMTATTTGKAINITTGTTANFNLLRFSGVGGAWNINGNIQAQSDINVATGTVTGTGNITLLNGSFYGNGLVSLGSGTTTINRTNTLGGTQGWTFKNLKLGSGVTTGTTTMGGSATTTISGKLTIATAHFLNAGSSKFDLSGSGTVFVESGTFLEGTSRVRYSGSAATNILSTGYYDLDLNAGSGSPTYTATGIGINVLHNLTVGGQSTTNVNFTTNDPALAVANNVTIKSNGTLVGSDIGSFTVGGSWSNTGTFTSSGGTVTFNGTGSATVAAGSSSFGNLLINGTGSVTVTANASTTGTLTLASTLGSFTQASSTTLSVGGVFSNAKGGAATTWTGSTLYLHSGTNYSINTKSIADAYGTLKIAANTHIRMWNSSASVYAINSAGSLYSQDHAAADGQLYVFGAYPGNGGTDYWSYAKDFDGTSLSTTSRAVTVRFASGASMALLSGGLQVLGGSGASTTIENQGSGTYGLRVGGTASTSWSYYRVFNTNSSGITFSGTPNVVTLSRGYFEVSQAAGTAMTVGGTVINANPAKTFTNNVFATTTAISAFNVTATGTAVSSWRFTNHSGNLAGEAHDVDPDGDPGYIVWDDSAANITISGHVYSDEGTTVSAACTGTTTDIHLVVAGLTTYTGSCNASTGAYSIPGVSYSPGDSFIVYITGRTQKAATVSKDPVSNISNFDLYEHRVIVRHENTNPLTIADMAPWDSSDDSDVQFTASVGSPNTLVLPANTKLLVWTSKEFKPTGNMTISGGGAGASYDGSVEVYANGKLTFTGTEQHSVGGSFVLDSGATFDAGLSTTTFTTTGASRSITVNNGHFYNVSFTGSGSWLVGDTNLFVHSFKQSAGSFTLPTGTTTVSGSWINNGGAFTVNGSLLNFTATSTGKTVRAGGSNFAQLLFTGTGGAWSMTDTNATSTSNVTIKHGTLTLLSGKFSINGSFRNEGGTVNRSTSNLILRSASAATLLASSSDLYSVTIAGVGPYTMSDHNLTLANNLTLQAGTTTLATGTLAIGGSLTASTGHFNNATGTILFNATSTGKTINPGSSKFYNVTFGGPSGGWTITNSATTTHNFTISTAASFTQQSGTRLYVGNVFTNSVGGAATTWTGSTLVLNSGSPYAIDTKTAGGDNYDTLIIGANTDISAWNSHATTTTVNASGSFYSMDHSGVDGSLYIYGDYHISTTSQYWSYAKDFDGTTLSGASRRAVTVHIAANATTTVDGATLNITGASGFETTITNQGSGTYSFKVTSGTYSALYYKYRNLNSVGLSISGTPTISSLSNGDFQLAVSGGSLISLTSGALDANASMNITGDAFATTTAITGHNVNLTGSTSNAWTFSSYTGNLAGEAYDVDGATACGSIRWSNSSCQLTQETHYRYRNDNGGINVPNNEWYNASWTDRKSVSLTNDDPTSYTNAVVKVHVTYDGDMNSDFSDLRFTDQSGTTTIPYFIDRYTPSTDADVWVKVPSLPANETTPVYMYFKNASASTTSSGPSTFIAADDFEDVNITEYSGDTSLFAVDTNHVYGGGYGLDNAGHTTAQATNGIARFDQTISQGETIRYFQYVDTSGGADEVCTMFAVQSPVTLKHNYGVCLEQVTGPDYMAIVKDVAHSALPANRLASTTVTYSSGWYKVEINWKTNNTINVSLYDSTDTLVATTSATNSTYTSGGYGYTFWYNSGGWDNFSARPTLTTEPTVHFGATQGNGGATWKTAIDSPLSVVPGDKIRLRTSVENSGLQITNQTFNLEYATKGASPSCQAVPSGNYATVPVSASCGSSPLCMATSSYVTNNSNTTNLLHGPSGDFTAGKVITDPSYTTSPLTIDQNAYTELEYVLSATVNATSSAYCMRVTNGGSPLDTYLQVPELQLEFDPIVSTLSLNGGNDISLTPGTTTLIYATGTVTDLNGYADIVSATGTIYRSGAGASCTANQNNCYISAGSPQCTLSSCSGNSCEVSCSARINYFADPTDVGTYSGEEWLAYIEAVDHESNIGVGSSPGVEMLSLRALDVSSAINYGSLAVSSSTGSFNPTTTVNNIGNSGIDLNVEGTDLTDGGSSHIPASEQIFATSTFNYSSCAYCTTLATTTVPFNINLSKPTSTAPVSGVIYWGIAIPFGVSSKAHQGTNIFYAVGS